MSLRSFIGRAWRAVCWPFQVAALTVQAVWIIYTGEADRD
jgi:hypothetical protein